MDEQLSYIAVCRLTPAHPCPLSRPRSVEPGVEVEVTIADV